MTNQLELRFANANPVDTPAWLIKSLDDYCYWVPNGTSEQCPISNDSSSEKLRSTDGPSDE